MTDEEYSVIWTAIEDTRENLGTILEDNESVPSAEVERGLVHIRNVLAELHPPPGDMPPPIPCEECDLGNWCTAQPFTPECEAASKRPAPIARHR